MEYIDAFFLFVWHILRFILAAFLLFGIAGALILGYAYLSLTKAKLRDRIEQEELKLQLNRLGRERCLQEAKDEEFKRLVSSATDAALHSSN